MRRRFDRGCFSNAIRWSAQNEKKPAQFQVLFQQNLPPDTMFQITLWTSPGHRASRLRHGEAAGRQARRRDEFPAQERAASIVRKRGEFLKKHTEKQISERNPIRVRDVKVYVTVIYPCRTLRPSERDRELVRGASAVNTASTLETIGMVPKALDAEGYTRAISAIVNWGPDAAWRTAAAIYEEERPIREPGVRRRDGGAGERTGPAAWEQTREVPVGQAAAGARAPWPGGAVLERHAHGFARRASPVAHHHQRYLSRRRFGEGQSGAETRLGHEGSRPGK